jgi:TolB protein
MSPSWSADGSEIIFSSNRSGGYEIWSKHIDSGELERVTNGWGGRFPAVSPDGRRIASIHEGGGLFLFDRESRISKHVDAPRRAHFAPAWSNDGRCIAVTGSDWGKMDIYLVTADGSAAVQLTKTTRREMQPDWSPGDSSLVTVTMREEEMQLWILTGLQPYRDRLYGRRESGSR